MRLQEGLDPCWICPTDPALYQKRQRAPPNNATGIKYRVPCIKFLESIREISIPIVIIHSAFRVGFDVRATPG